MRRHLRKFAAMPAALVLVVGVTACDEGSTTETTVEGEPDEGGEAPADLEGDVDADGDDGTGDAGADADANVEADGEQDS